MRARDAMTSRAPVEVDTATVGVAGQEEPTTSLLRWVLLALFLAGAAGVLIDLALIGHYEDPWQFAPLIVLGGSAGAGVVVASRPSRVRLRAFRVALLAVIASGLAGLALHYRANLEFEREVSPALAGVALTWKALQGASPPSAAPATLLHLALIGWAYTIRHPALRSSPGRAPGGNK